MGIMLKTRSERVKLEEEMNELNREIAELSSETGEAAIQKLQDEIKDCKAILKCGVCFDRPKEVNLIPISIFHIHDSSSIHFPSLLFKQIHCK